jgi:hypothetical protein
VQANGNSTPRKTWAGQALWRQLKFLQYLDSRLRNFFSECEYKSFPLDFLVRPASCVQFASVFALGRHIGPVKCNHAAECKIRSPSSSIIK